MAGFRYKKVRTKRPELAAHVIPDANVASESYAGQIDGKRASQGEENLLHAAYKSGQVTQHQFREIVGTGLKELDFLFLTKTGENVAIQIRDYEFIHHGLEAEAKDTASDTYIMQELAKDGILLRGNRVYSISDDDLTTVADARKKLEEILG
jgi:hypothetical protein